VELVNTVAETASSEISNSESQSRFLSSRNAESIDLMVYKAARTLNAVSTSGFDNFQRRTPTVRRSWKSALSTWEARIALACSLESVL
jgi:hypothetical protein